MGFYRFALAAFFLSGAIASAGGGAESQNENPDRRWAEPVGLCQPENVYKISDVLYRGGHVSRAGAEQLRCMGIRTAISFRVVGRDVRFVSRAGMNAVHLPFQAWQPNEDQAVEFLKIATNPACQPVYFACKRGADRAGMMCAVYRVAVEGWSKEEALCEMIEGPYGYNPIWKKVVQFVREMDVERIRCRAGLVSPDAIGAPQNSGILCWCGSTTAAPTKRHTECAGYVTGCRERREQPGVYAGLP